MEKSNVFVSGYTHDIFVSYAEVDDQEGWVAALVDGLKKKLPQKLGTRNFSLWMDSQLAPNKPVTPEILNNVTQTATLIVILSPGYLVSERCQKELDSFLKAVAEQPRSKSRIFVVERDKIEDSKRPPEFKDLEGYRFWRLDREGKPPRILGDPKPNPEEPKDRPYYDQLTDLSHYLAEELKKLKSENTALKQQQQDDRSAVFLAEVTDDLRDKRDEVKRALELEKFKVLPETHLILGDSEIFRQTISKELEQCDVFVQLLSELPGRACPDKPDTTYTYLQFEQAGKAEKAIFQWHDPNLDIPHIKDENHKTLLEKSESVIAQPFEAFKQEVVRKVKELSAQKSTKPRTSTPFVFINASNIDASLAGQIQKVLKKHKLNHALPLWEGKPTRNSEELEDFLNVSHGLIVVYGEAPVYWVRIQLRKYIEFEQTRKPLKAIALYEGPPTPKDDPNIFIAHMHRCVCHTGLDEKELHPFFDALNAGEAL